jgi:hypothetical protein
MGVLILLIVLVLAYFLPSFLAYQRKAPDQNTVAVINLLLGWTVIGWIVALALALRDRRTHA